MTNMQELMQMGQQLQARIQEMQSTLEAREVSASSGGGMVTARVNGKGEIRAIAIDATVVDPADVEMLEDLVTAAVSEAQAKARKVSEEEIKKATGGLPIPPGLGLF